MTQRSDIGQFVAGDIIIGALHVHIRCCGACGLRR